MSKYLSGILAMVVAIAFVAFTPAEKSTMVYFTFNGDTDVAAEVEDESLWVEASLNSNCNGSNKACQIEIDEDFVSGSPNTGRSLAANTNVQLDAVEGGVPDHYRPELISGSSIGILNKP